MRLLACWLAVSALVLCADARPKRLARESVCGYESCNAITEGVLNVHVVPHTHDDVGWLKTLDQYYYGSKINAQRAGVQYILDSAVNALLQNPARKFIYVETSFFWRWWQEQNNQTREDVQLLVAEGRLEFVGGAWSMNDEATTHYQSIVDQFSWGLRKLNDTFGECGRPRAGWQIDPFGHSREMANLLSAMGYDGMVLNRVDFQDKRARVDKQEMEMIWRGSDDLGASSDLFTGITFNHYSPPPGFCFDLLCNDDPIIDDITSPDYNVDIKVKDFMDFVERQQAAYKTDNIMITMGDDFNYQDAHVWFKNLDKLIKYVNAKEPQVNLFYSTPSCYIKAVHDANVTLPTKQDDFFPYGSDDHSYWTGYFSSRPTLKYFERKGNNILQVCKQLNAITYRGERDNVGLDMLRSALGVMQHHDAITGTEKQNVANDYARILDMGIQGCLVTVRETLNKLMTDRDQPRLAPKDDEPFLTLTLCELNITQCSTSELATNFIVTVYNPLAQTIDHNVRVPVAGSEYLVRDPEGNVIETELVPIKSNSVKQLARDSIATGELVFLAADLPPLGYRSYYVSSVARQRLGEEQEEVEGDTVGDALKEADDDEYSIGNDRLTLSVDPETGFVSQLFIAEKNLSIPLKQELVYYLGEGGNNNGRSSGAYVFRPRSSDTIPVSTKPVNSFHKGPLVEELYQTFSDWASQTIRIYKDSNHVEFEWVVGPIPVEDDIGREVVSRFSTEMDTAGTFYTDSNGRQLLKRVRNQRASWDVDISEPASGNYYPVTSVISIHDEKTGLDLSVLTDRAQGGTSLKDGELELMIHRRLLHDDGFGVGEALNEQVGGSGLVAKGTHYLHIGDSSGKGAVTRRQLILAKQLGPTVLVSSADDIAYLFWMQATNEFSGLSAALPANVHLLTVEPWKEDAIIIRLEHFLQKTDDPEDLSKPVVVNIDEIFSNFKVLAARETTLAGNVYLEDSNRMNWKSEGFKDASLIEIASIKQMIKEEKQEIHDLAASAKSLEHTKHHTKNASKIKVIKERIEGLLKQLQKLQDSEDSSKNRVPSQKKNKLDGLSTEESKNLKDGDFEITLEPMQIRTFILTVSKL